MPNNSSTPLLRSEEFASLGTDIVAYVREISGTEAHAVLPEGIELEESETYWGLFAADGQPLMVSNQPHQVMNEAFYNDLQALRLN